MEDEGRKAFIGERPTLQEARELREQERHGYYFSSDFEIIEAQVSNLT